MEIEDVDSGIYLRGSAKSQVNIWMWPIGSGEVYGYRMDKKMPPEVRAGVTPKKKMDRPRGEWNTFEITMKGDRLWVKLHPMIHVKQHTIPVEMRLRGLAARAGCPRAALHGTGLLAPDPGPVRRTAEGSAGSGRLVVAGDNGRAAAAPEQFAARWRQAMTLGPQGTAESPVDGDNAVQPFRVLAVADSDSYLKFACATLESLGEGWECEVLLVRSPSCRRWNRSRQPPPERSWPAKRPG